MGLFKGHGVVKTLFSILFSLKVGILLEMNKRKDLNIYLRIGGIIGAKEMKNYKACEEGTWR
jgi:hypothetical protein